MPVVYFEVQRLRGIHAANSVRGDLGFFAPQLSQIEQFVIGNETGRSDRSSPTRGTEVGNAYSAPAAAAAAAAWLALGMVRGRVQAFVWVQNQPISICFGQAIAEDPLGVH